MLFYIFAPWGVLQSLSTCPSAFIKQSKQIDSRCWAAGLEYILQFRADFFRRDFFTSWGVLQKTKKSISGLSAEQNSIEQIPQLEEIRAAQHHAFLAFL